MYLNHNHWFFFRMNLTNVICDLVITISIFVYKIFLCFLFYFRITKFTWNEHILICLSSRWYAFNKHKQIKDYCVNPCIYLQYCIFNRPFAAALEMFPPFYVERGQFLYFCQRPDQLVEASFLWLRNPCSQEDTRKFSFVTVSNWALGGLLGGLHEDAAAHVGSRVGTAQLRGPQIKWPFWETLF